MKRLKVLLAVVAAMAMLLIATSLAMAVPSMGTGVSPYDLDGRQWCPQAVTDSNGYASCPPWMPHWGC